MPEKPYPLVFVVDDEPIISSTLSMILKSSRFESSGFTNPLEAIEALNASTPDLLITDVMMPEMTGVELAVQFQGACPACKILLFSGQAKTGDLLEQAKKHGYDFQILTKPVHPKDLLAAIRSL